jgi:hypothetical protein
VKTPASSATLRRLALPLVLTASLAASLVLSTVRQARVPSATELDGLALAVRAGFETGDVVVSSPPWMVGAQERLGDLPYLAPRVLDGEDLRGYRRVWLVEQAGASPQVHTTLAGVGELREVARAGPGHLSLVTLRAPEVAVFDLWRDLEQAEVLARYAPGEPWSACDTAGRDRWSCPREPQWSYVGRELRLIGNEPRTCLWAHPLLPGGTLRVQLRGAVAGRSVSLAYGFFDEVVWRLKTPVSLRLLAGEELLFSGERRPEPGLGRAVVALPAGAGPIAVRLTPSYTHGQHFCLGLRGLAPATQAVR